MDDQDNEVKNDDKMIPEPKDYAVLVLPRLPDGSIDMRASPGAFPISAPAHNSHSAAGLLIAFLRGINEADETFPIRVDFEAMVDAVQKEQAREQAKSSIIKPAKPRLIV